MSKRGVHPVHPVMHGDLSLVIGERPNQFHAPAYPVGVGHMNSIAQLFPAHDCYVELFAGAAALFFMKEQSKTEVLNDINGELVNLYRVTQHHLEEFHKQFKHSLVSRQIFDWLKMTHPETLTDIQRAARFFYLQKTCFGAKVESQTFGIAPSSPPKMNLLRIEEDLSDAHLRLARCYIEHLPWEKCVARFDREYSLFYADPPYWETEGYGVAFGLEQYEALAEAAKAIKGKMIISLNDHPEMRRVFAGLDIQSVDIKYTVGGGAKAQRAAELIIKNF